MRYLGTGLSVISFYNPRQKCSIVAVPRWISIFAVLIFSLPALGRDKPRESQPINQFKIGRRTFFDFGPPFDFYEIYLIRTDGQSSAVERITLTPHGGSCMVPAKFERTAALVREPIVSLLEGKNPCAIPEKELRREMKRCKKCLVFSGAVTTMEVQCGPQDRVIRSLVLDKDWFDSAPGTPQNTSRTMRLLSRLDDALGSNVMDRPAFSSFLTASEQTAPAPIDSETLSDISSGKYDALFQGAPEKPSDIYLAARRAIPTPDIKVEIESPARPEIRPAPIYPPLARLAHIEGKVVLRFRIDSDGNVANLTTVSGHPMLRGSAENAVKSWKFRREDADHDVDVTVDFIANCPTEPSK